jgi:hypothetical protein
MSGPIGYEELRATTVRQVAQLAGARNAQANQFLAVARQFA